MLESKTQLYLKVDGGDTTVVRLTSAESIGTAGANLILESKTKGTGKWKSHYLMRHHRYVISLLSF